ncbi:hypothetical protein HYV43_01955 [Candidatus Micrarchaeota archaeon]|nr:hypothetical protein [Candidatus Micrarchaeota archaeon]
MSEAEFEKAKAIFEAAGVPFEVLEHEPTRTSQESAQARGSRLSQGVKSMLVKFTRKGSDFFVMVNVPADKRLDLKKVKAVLQAQEARLASVADVVEQTGCELGAVPPVGHKNRLAVLVDLKVFDEDVVEFNAGLTTKSIRLKSADFRAALKKMGAAGFDLTE